MSDETRFDGVVDEIREALEHGASRALPPPDFRAVVDRAHHLDPSVVDETAVRAAAELAPVVPLRPRSGQDDARLDVFLQDVRAGLERSVEERRLRPIPRLPSPPRRRPAVAWTVTGLAAAAVLVLGLVSPRLMRPSRSGPSDRSAAGLQSEGAPVVHRARQRGSEDRPPQSAPSTDPTPPPPPIEPDDPPPELDPPVVRPRQSRAQPAETDLNAHLRRLDAEAQERWRAGDLHGAEERFREIVRLAGRGPMAELAYGDLFAIADRSRSVAARRRLWTRYLRRFPRGRFADDARAGLCRHAPAADRAACWDDYLRDMPTGSYRREAAADATAQEEP